MGRDDPRPRAEDRAPAADLRRAARPQARAVGALTPEADVHEISAGGVVVGPLGRIVVVSQKGFSWSLPKGRVNPGEDLLVAARREVREETGLVALDLVAPLPQYRRSPLAKPHRVKTLVFYLFRTEETRLAPEDPDNPEALWLPPPDAVLKLSHPRDRQFLDEVVAAHGLR